jgi:hypothetical protein
VWLFGGQQRRPRFEHETRGQTNGFSQTPSTPHISAGPQQTPLQTSCGQQVPSSERRAPSHVGRHSPPTQVSPAKQYVSQVPSPLSPHGSWSRRRMQRLAAP